MYVATNYLYRWTDNDATTGIAGSWEPRLGTPPQQLANSGYVNAIAIAVNDFNRIYTGATDGEVWMSPNTGQSWTRLDYATPNGSSRFQPISFISVAPGNASDVVVGGGTSLQRCKDTTANPPNWVDASGVGGANPLTLSAVVQCFARDSIDPTGTWYVGTNSGVVFTVDEGTNWHSATQAFGLPPVQVNDLKVSLNDYLYAATFGRGLWRISLLPGSTAGTGPRHLSMYCKELQQQINALIAGIQMAQRNQSNPPTAAQSKRLDQMNNTLTFLQGDFNRNCGRPP
jgi:hypothetical protein